MKYLKTLFLSVSLIFFATDKNYSSPINQYIHTVSPSQNAVSVNKSSNITITFTQDMNPATINNANIKVFGYQTGLLPVTIDYNAAGKNANINPNQDLKAGEKISVTLTSGIRNIANESINPFVYTFYVKATGGNTMFNRTSNIDFIGSVVIKAGDIDHDGDLDLVINNKIYTNNGSAVFSFLNELNTFGYPELADFDNDGDLDILLRNEVRFYSYINNGLGVFVQNAVIPGGINTFGDYDGDGFLDVAFFTSVSNISVYKNTNGNFIFSENVPLNLNCNVYPDDYIDGILSDDFDNDGDIDLMGISGNSGSNSITFNDLCRDFNNLINIGNGNFNSQIIYHNNYHNAPLHVIFSGDSKSADFNNDGYVDIVSPGAKINNSGNGIFTFGGSLIGFSNSIIGDLNGNEYFDLVSNIVPSSLLLNINNGYGNLIDSGFITGNYSEKSASGDFDNDGDIDIAVKDFYTNTIAILLNGDIPLPVELSSFTSETDLNNITLKWTTSSEENNTGYDIEKTIFNVQSSMFNENWSKAGFVTGNGTTNNTNNYTFTDKYLQSGKYKYRLKQTDFNGNFKYYELSNEVSIGIPDKFYLSQNYPNPFNPSTNLGFGISEFRFVTLKVYDVIGNEVAVLVNENKAPGYYNIQFDGSKLSSGVYFYRLESSGFVQTKRMMLLK